MQSGYYSSAWADVKNTPGWFGKLCLLTLISLIPIFGPIAVAGYVYGWARDLSWGIHAPMPAHIFGNEDGRQYSRGFFTIVISVVFCLVPCLVYEFISGFMYSPRMSFLSGLIMFVVTVAFIALMVFAVLFSWIGSMRLSIYGRLSPGFQLGKIWSMMRHDPKGILRILGMSLLLVLISGLIIGAIVLVIFLIDILMGAATMIPLIGGTIEPNNVLSGSFMSMILFACICLVIIGFIDAVVTMYINLVVTRALGYWMLQFDVPQWRGQDDPMPFELQQQWQQQAAQGYAASQQSVPQQGPVQTVQPSAAQTEHPQAPIPNSQGSTFASEQTTAPQQNASQIPTQPLSNSATKDFDADKVVDKSATPDEFESSDINHAPDITVSSNEQHEVNKEDTSAQTSKLPDNDGKQSE
ncbi:MAG: DUF4013 domain-containing protein [Eggerthellaceae bacterium]|jgi:hypothetical protein|nr:DUF4013 domain-containing protein [Eggerthellaceae bacterium]